MIIDIFVLIILGISSLIAFIRGFIREVLTILGVVGGFFAASAFGAKLVPQMNKWLGVDEAAIEAGEKSERFLGIIPMEMVAQGLAYGAIFIGVLIILSIVSHFLAESIKNLGLGAIDRTLGVVFGLVRGILVLGLLFLPLSPLLTDEMKESWFAESRSYIYLEKSSAFVARFIPSLSVNDDEASQQEKTKSLSTREKLQSINLLKDKNNKPDTSEQNNNEPGYNEEFRDKMDQLIQEKIAPELINELNE